MKIVFGSDDLPSTSNVIITDYPEVSSIENNILLETMPEQNIQSPVDSAYKDVAAATSHEQDV